jgi:uncharacterized beta-barrel protein YwiB (DUF1934 family)
VTEKVFVTVKGLHAGSAGEGIADEDKIEVLNVGTYKCIAGKEYIKYNEVYEDGDTYTTIIKLLDRGVEMTKRGTVTTRMSFIEGEKTRNLYETPYGSIYMGIYSKNIEVNHEDDKITVVIDYSIEINYQHVSDSRVEIRVQSQPPVLV